MHHRLWLAAIAAFIASGAAPSPAKPAAPEPGTSVEMPYLIAPMEVEGKLVAYAYITTHIIGASQNAAVDIRLKVPFIQDAFVRDVNARAISKVDDPNAVDNDALDARLLADAQRVVGKDKVTAVQLNQVQITALRPNP